MYKYKAEKETFSCNCLKSYFSEIAGMPWDISSCSLLSLSHMSIDKLEGSEKGSVSF